MTRKLEHTSTCNPSGDVARRAFDVVAEAQRAKSLEALHEVTRSEFARLGVTLVLGAHTRRRGAGTEVEILFGDVTHPWCEHYRSQHWNLRCPVVAAAGTRPIIWSEIKAQGLRPAQSAIFDELAAFSFREGHIVMIDRMSDGITAVSLAGADFDPTDPAVRTAVHLLSLHYGLAGFRLLAEPAVEGSSGPRLTVRQSECLRWVRDGKTAWEIGAILNISARTVEEHLAKACEALNVRTRVQAVVEAARRRLIEF